MKRQRVVKKSPTKWSGKDDATENKKIKGKKAIEEENLRVEGERISGSFEHEQLVSCVCLSLSVLHDVPFKERKRLM